MIPVTAPGIYSEKIGKLQKSVTNWKFLFYLDNESFSDNIITIEHDFNSLKKLCLIINKISMLDDCKINLNLLQNYLNEIYKNDEILTQLFNITSNKRPRREILSSHGGLINGLGKIQHILFGTMDSDDAEEIDKAIGTINENQLNLFHLAEAQTTIITEFINDYNATEQKLNTNFKTIRKQINNQLNKIDNLTEMSQTFHIFDEISVALVAFSTTLISNQNQMIDLIQESALGKLSTKFLNSNTFLQAIRQIQLEQTTNKRFPFNLNKLNLRLLNSIIFVEPIYTNNHLLIEVKIPLVSEIFEIYKTTSLPLRFNNDLFYYVKISSDYVAINEDIQRYIFLSRSDLSQCIKFQKYNYLCYQNLIYHTNNIQNCEIKLFSGDVKPENCEIKIFKLQHELWFNLFETNAWLYVMPKPTSIKVVCDKIATIKKLQDSGIFRLKPNCKAFTQQISLQSQIPDLISKPIIYSFESILPNITVPENMSVVSPHLHNMEEFNLDKFSVDIKTLLRSANYNKSTELTTRSFLIISIIVIAITIILLILYKKFLKIKCTTKKIPANETSC